MLSKTDLNKLNKIADKIRIDIIEMSYNANAAHSGGALSCVEILTALYFKIMKINPKKPNDPKRDRLVFSKGHDGKALYSVLAQRGYFNHEILKTYEQNNTRLAGHSTRNGVSGVEISAGSLGHGLPIATGMAYSAKLDQAKHRVFAILSDGECDEGSTWEAILFAGHHRLNNLIVIVDYNKLQGFGYTKDILDLEPFSDKWRAFKWDVKKINGHDFDQIINSVGKTLPDKPLVIIANTIKGYKGPVRHVNQVSSQYKPPTIEELNEVRERLSK